jgi:carboxymethylenebutenolidase
MTQIDYFASLNSPWTYLGAARIAALAAEHGATLRIFPVDFRAVIFPSSGGLPVNQRSRERQAYRLQELRRWPKFLGIPLNIAPKHVPFDEILAASAVIAVRETLGDAHAVDLAHRIMKAAWHEEQNCADPATLGPIIAASGLEARRLLDLAADPAWAERRLSDSRAALARGVFGAPSYVIGDEIFWGQDRLDFVERCLAGG